MAFRTDRGSLRSPRRLDDGRVIVEGVLTRTGVFAYRNDDGSERLEYRPPSEVFHKDSILSFQMVPVTDDHPLGLVTAESVKAVAIGAVGENIRQDGAHLVAPLAINDAGAVAKLDAGKTSLSCGYTCDLDYTPGVSPEGERFDAIQTNIRGNHVALVDVGRAGPEARIRMDDAAHQTEDKPMKELVKALNDLAVASARADKAEADLKVEGSRADKAEAERDAAQEKQADADKLRADAADKFDAAVEARVQLVATAGKILGDEFKCDGKSDREIKVACTKVDCADKPDAYVDARFDMVVEAAAEGKSEEKIYAGMKRADNSAQERADGEPDSDAARKRMLERNRNAHQVEKK